MILQNYDYVNVLKQAYEMKKQKNPSFSVRSFSKHLGLGETFLSLLFNGRRQLPNEKAISVAEKLSIDEKAKEIFIQSVQQAQVNLTKLSQFKVKDDIHIIEDHESEINYKIIAENKYFTFLSLLDIDNKMSSIKWMSEMMSTSVEDLKQIILDLKVIGYISVEGETLKKRASCFQTPPNLCSNAIKERLQEGFRHAIDILQDCPIEKRHYSSETLVIAEDQIEHAKNLIREFSLKFAQLINMDSSQRTNKHVYMFSTQFLPLTDISIAKREE